MTEPITYYMLQSKKNQEFKVATDGAAYMSGNSQGKKTTALGKRKPPKLYSLGSAKGANTQSRGKYDIIPVTLTFGEPIEVT